MYSLQVVNNSKQKNRVELWIRFVIYDNYDGFTRCTLCLMRVYTYASTQDSISTETYACYCVRNFALNIRITNTPFDTVLPDPDTRNHSIICQSITRNVHPSLEELEINRNKKKKRNKRTHPIRVIACGFRRLSNVQ